MGRIGVKYSAQTCNTYDDVTVDTVIMVARIEKRM